MSKVRRYANTTAMMESVADKQMVGKAEVLSVVNQLFECMIDELKKGNSIRFEKLGTFSPIIAEELKAEDNSGADSGSAKICTDVVFRTNKACRGKLTERQAIKKYSK